MMQEENVISKIRESYKQVDLIFGTHNLYDLPVTQELITQFTEESLYALLNASFLYDFR